MNNDATHQYRDKFKIDLARIIGCNPDELPATTSKAQAAIFLGLTNPKTLNVWHSTGRHGIVMVKVGRCTEPTTDWLLDLKVAGVSTVAEVA